jgi:ATP-dependent RNA helicase RhlE
MDDDELAELDAVRVVALHGNKSQPARQKALEQFRAGQARVLVATDIAARGIVNDHRNGTPIFTE